MKVSSSFNNIDRVDRRNPSFKGVPANPKYIPEVLGSVAKRAGEYINTPEQKLLLATFALMFQPLVDLKFAREGTEIDTAIKTASKTIAGGLTGVAIRAAFLKVTDHFIGFQKRNKLNKLFFPDVALHDFEVKPEIAKLKIRQFNKTLGTIFALAFMMLFSNRMVDVPLTSDLQDFMSGIVKDKKSWLKSLSDVKDSRCKKIADGFTRKKNILVKIQSKMKDIFDVIKDNPDTKKEESK